MIVPIGPLYATQPATAPTAAAAGIVSTQAMAIWPATPHCTEASLRPAPAPKIEPVATWVVDRGKPEVRGDEDHRRRCWSRRRSPAGLDVADALAEGLDDPPAAHVGAQRDRQAGGEDHPERRARVGGQRTRGDQGERDDAHRLLRVVGAVGQRDHRGGHDLAEFEALLDGAVPAARGDPVGEVGRDQGDEPGDDRATARRAAGPCRSRPAKFTASAPAATQVAPIRPPNSACDELEGSPSSQVTRFHRIAPTRPAKITVGVISVSSTRPLEIVFATCDRTGRRRPGSGHPR